MGKKILKIATGISRYFVNKNGISYQTGRRNSTSTKSSSRGKWFPNPNHNPNPNPKPNPKPNFGYQ